jgi:hypothetical protein
MKAMSTAHMRYDNSQLEETEFALAISPCPRFEESKNAGESTGFAREHSGPDRRRPVQESRQTDSDEDELTETLTIGWAIALAIAVALAVYASGA